MYKNKQAPKEYTFFSVLYIYFYFFSFFVFIAFSFSLAPNKLPSERTRSHAKSNQIVRFYFSVDDGITRFEKFTSSYRHRNCIVTYLLTVQGDPC